jgi:hypothetical protein
MAPIPQQQAETPIQTVQRLLRENPDTLTQLRDNDDGATASNTLQAKGRRQAAETAVREQEEEDRQAVVIANHANREAIAANDALQRDALARQIAQLQHQNHLLTVQVSDARRVVGNCTHVQDQACLNEERAVDQEEEEAQQCQAPPAATANEVRHQTEVRCHEDCRAQDQAHSNEELQASTHTEDQAHLGAEQAQQRQVSDAAPNEELCQTTEVRCDEDTRNQSNLQDVCDHTNYSDNKQESNPAYCVEGELFGGHKCCGVKVTDAGAGETGPCNKAFVNQRSMDGFYPTKDKFIWYCKNIK